MKREVKRKRWKGQNIMSYKVEPVHDDKKPILYDFNRFAIQQTTHMAHTCATHTYHTMDLLVYSQPTWHCAGSVTLNHENGVEVMEYILLEGALNTTDQEAFLGQELMSHML